MTLPAILILCCVQLERRWI